MALLRDMRMNARRGWALAARLSWISITVAIFSLTGCSLSFVSSPFSESATLAALQASTPSPDPLAAAPASGLAAVDAPETVTPAATPTPEPAQQFYTVQMGDTLAQIAMLHNVSIQEIVEANDLPNPDVISAGQVLMIPQPQQPTNGQMYIIQPGDMLVQIAMVYGVSVEEIVAANGLTDPNMISIGQAIVIPTGPALEASERGCVLASAFVADITVADDTQLPPDAPFTAIWRMRNSGSCDWEEGYELVFVRGSSMDAPSSVPIPPTRAGSTLDLAVDMTAPSEPGAYTSVWQMQAPDGTLFGIQPYVRIVVPGAVVVATGQIAGPTWVPTQTPTIGETPVATVQPTPSPTYIPPTGPIISGITSHARQIFLAGQSMGNRPGVFAKVGDSITDSTYFMYGLGEARYSLHSYAYLEPALLFFASEAIGDRNSFNNDSVAATGGWTSVSILDPANARLCDGDTPLECEYQRIRPSVAIIMIGTNDSESNLASGLYQQNLSRMVEISIDMGVIPVLTTIPWNMYRDPRPYNAVIASTALAYDVPLLDYWATMETLDNRGLSQDNVHPSTPLDGNTFVFSEDGLRYGYNMRNLVTLQMLDALWQQVMY
jgi:LysM repeat protein